MARKNNIPSILHLAETTLTKLDAPKGSSSSVPTGEPAPQQLDELSVEKSQLALVDFLLPADFAAFHPRSTEQHS